MLPLACAALLAAPTAAPIEIVLDGAVPDDGLEHFTLPFEVPAGIVELRVAHAPLDDADILDWGLLDDNGAQRGYGGGNLEDAVVGEHAASRSYRPGPIGAGTWAVTVGKAKLTSAAPGYRVTVTLSDVESLPAADDRAAYAPVVLSSERRFYAGDFHVHSEDSGDARPPLLEIHDVARAAGLDFVVVTDHNTDAHVDKIGFVQPRFADLLLVPGVEFTTYGGHATGFGATAYVDHRLIGGRTVDDAARELGDQGALFSINHPSLELGDLCIGCAWTNDVPSTLHAVEIETGGYRQAGRLFGAAAIAFWETLLDDGRHLAALGGSDDHQAGQGSGSPIGNPTTLVLADELSVEALRAGILASRTVVKLQDANDPMIVLDTDPPRGPRADFPDAPADTVHADGDVTLTATVTGGVGARFRFVQNALGAADAVDVTTDPQTFTLVRTPDAGGGLRVRAEVLVDDAGEEVPRTITSYVWLAQRAPTSAGCGCGSASGVDGALAAVGCLALRVRTRKRRNTIA